MRKTEWYPGTVKPVRVGFYEIKSACEFGEWFDYWDGELWRKEPSDPPFSPMSQDSHRWRGLTEEQK